jgi:chemotaxis protein methyltransferase CheR
MLLIHPLELHTQSLPRQLGRLLNPQDFKRLAAFIHSYSGIVVSLSKQTMLEGRLNRRVRALGFDNLDDYCDYLFEEDGLEEEAVHLIDAVTTNKTDFFREPEHFEYLMSQALPQLLMAGRGHYGQPLKMWSAACSTGAEPYTLAMLMNEARKQKNDLCTFILGTDICTHVLETAVNGIYANTMLAGIPAQFRNYVRLSRNKDADEFRVDLSLRAQVHYARLNLMDIFYPMDRNMDIIFCRNVLIYFDKPTQKAVVERLVRHLRPGGYLFLGHSDNLGSHQTDLQAVAPTIFRKA